MGLNRLIEETPQSYYWMGFLMADGYFKIGKNAYDCQLQLSMSYKDKEHMKFFADYIDAKVSEKKVKIKDKEYKQSTCSKRDKEVLPRIINKFHINKNKTFNPPENLIIPSDDLFISFIIGLIDGDGCIRKDNGCIIVACEKSWSKNLDEWFLRLWSISKVNSGYNLKIPKCKMDNGLCRIQTNHDGIKKFLLDKIEELNLIVLKRKWDNIKSRNLTIDSNALAERNNEIFKYVDEGHDAGWISKKMNMNYKNCWGIVKRYKS